MILEDGMRNHLNLLILAVTFLLVGTSCRFARDIPIPPTYDQECNPSSTYYLDLAQDTTDLAGPGAIPSDPQEALDEALRILAAKNVRIVQKEITGFDKLDRFTTAFPRKVFVKPGFFERDVRDQAMTLWHELVHIRQWERLGRAQMGAMWTIHAEGRWALETAAYRQTYRVMRLFGTSDEYLRERAPETSEWFYESYALFGMPRQCMIEMTSEILLSDLSSMAL